MTSSSINATALTNTQKEKSLSSVEVLTAVFLRDFPREAARKFESLQAKDTAEILSSHTPYLRQRVWLYITPSAQMTLMNELTDAIALELLLTMDSGPCASLISRMNTEKQEHYLMLMSEPIRRELKELMEFPVNSAGSLMDTRVISLSAETTVKETLAKLHQFPAEVRRRIYLLDSNMRLHGQVDLEELVCSEPSTTLEELSSAVSLSISALDPKEDVGDLLQKSDIDVLPVVDIHNRLLGIIRGSQAMELLKQDMASDLQSMVGASRDEQALSSSFFAVKKRQPWLQINLLTGFLAAAVVGMFESTIAQFTALAVLMPVAAGQSGNTGAQALAVTMRGLTLREITTRHWLKVMVKEASAGFINGIAIAVTCGAGVYVWSSSYGLALVIAMAMIISMTIAGTAGALVPIILKRLGQDPAQSSSIILTTVTDIAGFMSFLGIAAALSSLLVS